MSMTSVKMLAGRRYLRLVDFLRFRAKSQYLCHSWSGWSWLNIIAQSFMSSGSQFSLARGALQIV